MNISESTQEEKTQHEVYRFTKRKTFLYTKLTCKFYDTSTVGKSHLYLLHLYPGFYSFTEGAASKILDLLFLTETLLIEPSITVSRLFGLVDRRR